MVETRSAGGGNLAPVLPNQRGQLRGRGGRGRGRGRAAAQGQQAIIPAPPGRGAPRGRPRGQGRGRGRGRGNIITLHDYAAFMDDLDDPEVVSVGTDPIVFPPRDLLDPRLVTMLIPLVICPFIRRVKLKILHTQ